MATAAVRQRRRRGRGIAGAAGEDRRVLCERDAVPRTRQDLRGSTPPHGGRRGRRGRTGDGRRAGAVDGVVVRERRSGEGERRAACTHRAHGRLEVCKVSKDFFGDKNVP